MKKETRTEVLRSLSEVDAMISKLTGELDTVNEIIKAQTQSLEESNTASGILTARIAGWVQYRTERIDSTDPDT